MSEVAKRNKRNKRAGAEWQAALRKGFREMGYDTEELKLAGKEDEGDLVLRIPTVDDMYGDEPMHYVVIEAKAGEMHPAEFTKEAQVERLNFARHRGLSEGSVDGVAIVKRRGANWKDAYVLTTVRDYFGLGDDQ